MKKRAVSTKLSLAKETIRNLMTDPLRFVAGGSGCDRPTRGDFTACDCSNGVDGRTKLCTDTCGDCSGTQY